jgi:hypothetical protein
MMLGAASIPVPGDGEQRLVAPYRLHSSIIVVFKGTKPVQYLRGLPNKQSEIRQLERNVLEAKQRPRFSLMPSQNFGAQLKPWQRDSGLDPSLQLNEREVHVHRIS